jgi:hypothetical protein
MKLFCGKEIIIFLLIRVLNADLLSSTIIFESMMNTDDFSTMWSKIPTASSVNAISKQAPERTTKVIKKINNHYKLIKILGNNIYI